MRVGGWLHYINVWLETTPATFKNCDLIRTLSKWASVSEYVIVYFCYIRILFGFSMLYLCSSILFVRRFQFEIDKNLYRQFLLTSCEGVYKLWLSNGRSDCCRNYLLRLADFGVALSKLQPNGLGKVRIEPYSLL